MAHQSRHLLLFHFHLEIWWNLRQSNPKSLISQPKKKTYRSRKGKSEQSGRHAYLSEEEQKSYKQKKHTKLSHGCFEKPRSAAVSGRLPMLLPASTTALYSRFISSYNYLTAHVFNFLLLPQLWNFLVTVFENMLLLPLFCFILFL